MTQTKPLEGKTKVVAFLAFLLGHCNLTVPIMSMEVDRLNA